MLALIGGLRGILTAIGGAGAALILFLTWNAIWDNPRLHAASVKEGAAKERIFWEEARRKMILQMEAERKKAQEAIDQIEQQYLDQQDRDRSAIESLEDKLAEMEKADEASPDSRSRLFIPRGLSDDLNKIGR